MAFDVKQYVEELAKAGGWDDARKATVLEALSADPVAKVLGDGVLRQSDYSRNMDDLRKRQEEFEKSKTQTDQIVSWYNSNFDDIKQLPELKAEIARLKADGGGADDGGVDPTKFVPRDQYQRDLEAQSNALLNVVEDLAVVQGSNWETFGKPLLKSEVAELKKFALDNKLRLTDAYDKWVAPRIEEKRSKDVEARIAAAREEGRREGASHQPPVDNAPKETAPVWATRPDGDKPLDENARRARFREAYDEAGVAPATTK